MQHDQFLNEIAEHLPYDPDSANYDLYLAFLDIVLCDGGDDTFAHLKHYQVAFEFSKHVTLEHINQYDASDEHSDSETFLNIYLEIKSEFEQNIINNLDRKF